jgi:ribosomal protein S18 acetylase RimI-like enzyme
MKTWIKTFDIKKKIPNEHIRWCLKHNFSGNPGLKANKECTGGLLKEDLEDFLNDPKTFNTTKIYILHNGEKNMGWALVKKNWYESKKHSFMCYILPKFRRKGLATKLLFKAQRDFERVKVYSTEVNIGFYESLGMTKSGYLHLKKLEKK